jgi:hypothetical protein
MRFLAIAAACIAAAGCSSLSMHAQQVGALVDPYVGRPVSELVDRLGPPSSDYSSSAVATTYEWSDFSTGQSVMTGCRVLVEAHRSAHDSGTAAQAFRAEAVRPEEYAQWTIDTWSSFGSGCR